MNVFISSTYEDLKAYREAAVHVCQRLGLRPINMENFGPDDDNGVTVSHRKIDEADLYIGIFAHRYGYVPRSSTKSVTQMEYERATARGIQRLIWRVMDRYPWDPTQVEDG